MTQVSPFRNGTPRDSVTVLVSLILFFNFLCLVICYVTGGLVNRIEINNVHLCYWIRVVHDSPSQTQEPFVESTVCNGLLKEGESRQIW